MKTFLIALLVSLIALSSCDKKDQREYIVNKWRVTDVSDHPLSATLKKATFEFKKDGTWSLTGTPAADQAGMYSVAEDLKSFTTTDVRGATSTCELIHLSKDQLIFIDKQTGIKITAVPK
jgi:hypothetical protein